MNYTKYIIQINFNYFFLPLKNFFIENLKLTFIAHITFLWDSGVLNLQFFLQHQAYY